MKSPAKCRAFHLQWARFRAGRLREPFSRGVAIIGSTHLTRSPLDRRQVRPRRPPSPPAMFSPAIFSPESPRRTFAIHHRVLKRLPNGPGGLLQSTTRGPRGCCGFCAPVSTDDSGDFSLNYPCGWGLPTRSTPWDLSFFSPTVGVTRMPHWGAIGTHSGAER